MNKYQCLICYERCKVPISCTRCKKLLCKYHLQRINDKCPNCRLQPIEYKQEEVISKLIQVEINKEREEKKKSETFKCLAQGCDFQGKYIAMVKHRKRVHYDETIEQIIFPEEREEKNRKKMLAELLFKKLTNSDNQTFKKAFFLFTKTHGQISLKKASQMLEHLEVCPTGRCKKIVMTENSIFIGDEHNLHTDCISGIQFRTVLHLQ